MARLLIGVFRDVGCKTREEVVSRGVLHARAWSSARGSKASVLTDHLQSVDVDVATHHPALGVQLGAAEAHRHADLSVAVASHRQSALTLEAAGGPAAGGESAEASVAASGFPGIHAGKLAWTRVRFTCRSQGCLYQREEAPSPSSGTPNPE